MESITKNNHSSTSGNFTALRSFNLVNFRIFMNNLCIPPPSGKEEIDVIVGFMTHLVKMAPFVTSTGRS